MAIIKCEARQYRPNFGRGTYTYVRDCLNGSAACAWAKLSLTKTPSETSWN